MYFSRERLPWVRVEVKAGLLLMRNSKGYRVYRWLDWLKIRFVTQLTRHDQIIIQNQLNKAYYGVYRLPNNQSMVI